MDYTDIEKILAHEAQYLLGYSCKKIPKEKLHLPSTNWLDDNVLFSDRNCRTLGFLNSLFMHGRLAGSGYLSILPVDQGVEHGAGYSFSKEMDYFDPEKIVQLAIEGGCSAVASTLGVLGSVSRKYAHKIPFILKINHNELLTYPNSYDQKMFASVVQGYEMGAVGIGATIYFGAENAREQLVAVSAAFEKAHELGLATVLWCYLRSESFDTKDKGDMHVAADLTGQANYLGVTIEADIIKQKLPERNGGFRALSFGKSSDAMYDTLSSEHPIDLTRYQVANCFMGKAGLINSGGASGVDDLAQAVRTAVINKRAGGMGLIAGRKAFQKPMDEGVKLLQAIQDVYLEKRITVA